MPRVSIGLPVFNGARYLASSIESLLGQTFGDFELIICDNASTDATGEICREYLRRDPRIRCLLQPRNLGAGPNHNEVFRRASGEYFRWHSCDDLCRPEFLRRCVEALEEDGERVVLAWTRWSIIDEAGRVTIPEMGQRIPLGGHAPHRDLEVLLDHHPFRVFAESTPFYGLMRRRTLAGTRLHGSFLSADLVFLVEMALRGELREVPEVLFLRRRHPGNHIQGCPTPRERMAWIDTRKGKRSPLPRARMALEYLDRILVGPLPPAEKLRCLRAWLRWLGRREWRAIGGEIKARLLERATD